MRTNAASVRATAATLAALIATGGLTVGAPEAAHAAVSGAGHAPRDAAASSAARARPIAAVRVLPRSGLTRSALASSHAKILTGQSIVLTGRLTTGAVAVGGQAVVLQQRTGGAWETIGTARSGAGGVASFTVKPTRSATYRLAYAGAPGLSPSLSLSRSVTVTKPAPVVRPPAPSRATARVAGIGSNGRTGSATAQAVVAAARELSGKRYVYGTAGPDTFDCSGLVQYVFGKFGVSLPHNAHAQMSYGTPVAAADAAPGDLIFFLDGGHAYHVGIYAGGTMMIDAPNPRSTVGLRTIWGSNVVVRRLV